MGRIDELLGLFKPEDRAKAKSLLEALLDEVMGKVIGKDEPRHEDHEQSEYNLPGVTTAILTEEMLTRNKLRNEQRQALQAIRDSVSGGK